jgi:hypothetical protein
MYSESNNLDEGIGLRLGTAAQSVGTSVPLNAANCGGDLAGFSLTLLVEME